MSLIDLLFGGSKEAITCFANMAFGGTVRTKSLKI